MNDKLYHKITKTKPLFSRCAARNELTDSYRYGGRCMQQRNRAAYMISPKKIELRELPMPTAKPGEVILKVEYVGVCGSDVHFLETGVRKGKPFPLPFILGHECAGTVTEVGDGVKSIKVGERVCFEPQITCGKCVYCRSGHYNICLLYTSDAADE